MKKDLLVFVVTYNSSFRLKHICKKLFNLKKKLSFDILISDDCSTDNTSAYFPKTKKGILININRFNLGYGGNVKKCLNYALKKNYKYAVMIHGDNQYDSRYINSLYKKISRTNSDAVTGSRMMKPKDALNGKMPLYKWLGNFILTKLFNLIFKTNFTDAHTGLWIYNLKTLRQIKINNLDNGFNFDNQMRIKYIKMKKNILEVPIKTYYRNEKSSYHFIYALKFVNEIVKSLYK